MTARSFLTGALAALLCALPASPLGAAEGRARVSGNVRDLQNALTLPGVVVEVVGRGESTVTNLDGEFVLDLPAGSHVLKTTIAGYQERTVAVEVGAAPIKVDIGIALQSYAEEITVSAEVNAASSSAEAQLAERKSAAAIMDNMGAEDMSANGDSDAAAAMARITGLSVVDDQYVFVRGLGERYSNTTLRGSVVPTTEPDKKVVPLDLFPSALLDSVQVVKTFSPDRSAEFAGGLVDLRPLRLPASRVFSLSIGGEHNSVSTGKNIPLSPLDGRDRFGYDDGLRALPGGFPASKIVRRGIYSPNVGFSRDEISGFGRLLGNSWQPAFEKGQPGQDVSLVFGQRFGSFGVVASLKQDYEESYVEEDRRFFRIGDDGALEAASDYRIQTGQQKAQLGAVLNLAWQLSGNHRISLDNFYTHSGRDEGRVFEGPNTENNFIYRNYRLQFVEEGLISNTLAGEHYFPEMGNARVDWHATWARASRDEPDLRETLYQRNCVAGTSCLQGSGSFLLADESQSGFRMFNTLDDETVDLGVDWTALGSGSASYFKFGLSYVERTRDFQSRRFRFIPNTANTGGSVGINLALTPEELFASQNVGSVFRFNEETRPVDAYGGDQNTLAGYGLADLALSDRLRLIAGARVERFDQQVDTFDPFGLFVSTISSSIEKTDVFPSASLVYAATPDVNLRLGASITTNRPEFRELAPFEFVDVVGSRAVKGNPELERALIQNFDARVELLPGGRSVLALSAFYKNFDQPIERVVIAGAQPIVTFQNADSARNFGLEVEAARQLTDWLFFNVNYTFVDSKITLAAEQRTVQTSLERPLAGQSKHVLNAIGEVTFGGFSARALYNYFGDRISDVGSNGAPDVVEQGRGILDFVLQQRIGRFSVKLAGDNVTDAEYLFTQGNRDQRLYKLGRTFSLSLGLDVF
jgi:outer membrane receptor protein involved in Fe transport